ncbi:MAG: leucine-rich repeat domain-containing protein [Ruminococcaceae bacterium]|nr:leucine-rich repeat domain-containing protein [Oscillospiraceae bacterium]
MKKSVMIWLIALLCLLLTVGAIAGCAAPSGEGGSAGSGDGSDVGTGTGEGDSGSGSGSGGSGGEGPGGSHQHSYGAWSVVVEAGCLSEGEERGVCACGDVQTRPIEPKGHSYGAWSVQTEADCMTEGSRVRACACGDEQYEPIPIGEHSLGPEATCTEDQICTVCLTVMVPAAHQNVVVDVAVEPTCSSAGYTAGEHCKTCGEVLIPQEERERLPHTFNRKYCRGCGAAELDAESTGLIFTPNTDGTCTVTGYGSCNDLVLVIPTYSPEGELVTGIEKNAFLNGSFVGVAFPPSLETIGNYAFAQCRYLKHVYVRDLAAWCGVAIGVDSDMSASPFNYASELWLNDTHITELVIPETVTEIGCRAFASTDIVSVRIHAGVQKIGEYAFASCESLTDIQLDEGLTHLGDGFVFERCKTLKSVTVPGSVTDMGSSTFNFCSELSDVTLQEGIRIVSGFSNCKALSTITIPQSATAIGHGAFSHCAALSEVVVPDGVALIDAHAFNSCDALRRITLGASVTSVGEKAFWRCKALTDIVLPDGVTRIGEEAFSECSALANVTLGKGLRDIGAMAFDKTAITSVTLSDAIRSIGYSAFQSCEKLLTVVIPATNEELVLERDIFYNCTALEHVTLEAYVKEIPSRMFAQCKALTEIALPASVESVRGSAFNDCEALTKADMPGVTLIEVSAFSSCVALVSINMPEVTALGKSAFAGCKLLRSIILPEGLVEIGDGAFSGTNLQWMVIPRSVKTVGEDVFPLKQLSNVYYAGDAASWEAIEMRNGKRILTEMLNYYAQVQPTGEGQYWHYVDGVPTKW